MARRTSYPDERSAIMEAMFRKGHVTVQIVREF